MSRNSCFNDIPDVLVSHIFSLVTDTRARNAMSLVCKKWLLIERSTRTSLTLRGNIGNLVELPSSFRSVTDLDLSVLSPWGYPIFDETSPSQFLFAQFFRERFPAVKSLVVYARTPLILHLLASHWPCLRHVKLVRWHQRAQSTAYGSDFQALFDRCTSLESLDLSQFYCWTEDLPPAFQAYPSVAASLTRLNILRQTSAEGFKSTELISITGSCPNLRELRATCVFDGRFIGFVGDETLLSLATNCPLLSVLHLVDTGSNTRGNPHEEGFSSEDAGISHTALVDFFSKLPLLEELVLDIGHNVRDSWPALEILNSKCPKLKSLKLGHFHGICRGIDARPDGIAICSRLESLSIKNSADLTDSVLISIGLGCPRIRKFEVHGCKRITEMGMSKVASLLRKTLIDVKISCCKNLNAMSSLQALELIRDRIQKLHIDCVWENVEDSEAETSSRNGNSTYEHYLSEKRSGMWDERGVSKKLKYDDNGIGYSPRSWPKLRSLSLWIAVGELLTPLASSGLEDCPMLEEIHIKVEGDCRQQPRPSTNAFGLQSLACYPQLQKMYLDCGDAVGFSLTAPSGYLDLSFWERFYLNGIGSLNLKEVNYWPPQDPDVNQRGLSLPAAGLLADCKSLRKLFIHGTAHEHFMKFLLKIPNLRDVQLREEYYPAPDNDTSTEMRVPSCLRFETGLNNRRIPD